MSSSSPSVFVSDNLAVRLLFTYNDVKKSFFFNFLVGRRACQVR
jgi:hypothetical protein